MKKLLVVILLVLANHSYAGESTLSPIVGVTKFSRTFLLISNTNLDVDNNIPTLGIAYRYRFDNGAEVDASYSYAKGDFVASDQSFTGDLEVTNLNVSINYRVNPTGSFQPYFGIGPVYNQFDFSTKSGSGGPNTSFDSIELLFKVGLDYQINKNFNVGAAFNYSKYDYTELGNHFFEGDYRRLIVSAGFKF